MRVPLFIEMEGKNVLIIGGGSVGTGRAKKFLSAGANVTVLSLEFSDELKRLAAEGGVELVKGDASDKRLLENLISKSCLVVVALNTLEFNDIVIEFAKRHGALVNLANDASRTEVVVPFETEVGGLRVAITSEGKSGVVVREALKRVADYLSRDKEIHNLLNLMQHLKERVKNAGIPVDIRMKLYFEVFGDERFRALVKEGEIEAARKRLEEIVEASVR